VTRVSIVATRFALVTERELLLPVSEGDITTAEEMLRCLLLYSLKPVNLQLHAKSFDQKTTMHETT
jgi:hypothetical protein